MSTAELRSQARDAQQALNWAVAADLYQQAIDAYPGKDSKSALRALDISKLTEARNACAAMAA